MANYHLRIVTPDRLIFDGVAEKLIVRTVDGDVCILANHINYLAPLGIGEAKVVAEGAQPRNAAVNGGMLSVVNNDVNVIATTFEWADEIDVARAEHAKEEAERRMQQLKEQDKQFRIAEAKLKRAIARIQATK
ncbi:MAG: ATP synthase F1 subunit epsilon [Clostridia bacterium]|nr:ATP synthase F1 subunit epsilon [Clostridia bacterium]MDO4356224.1 ATP synthase F1 subunit epsilon [Clostridia bacterium]